MTAPMTRGDVIVTLPKLVSYVKSTAVKIKPARTEVVPPVYALNAAEAPTLNHGMRGAAKPVTRPRDCRKTPTAIGTKALRARGFHASIAGEGGPTQGIRAAVATKAAPITTPTMTEAVTPAVTFSFAGGYSSAYTDTDTDPVKDERPEEPEEPEAQLGMP